MRPPQLVLRQVQEGPGAELRLAQADLAAAEHVVADASEQYLKDCLVLSPAERIRHLDDPNLVLADRIKLRRTVEASLVPEPRRLPRLWRRGQGSRHVRSLVIQAALSPLTISLIVVGAPWLYVSWQNTRPLAKMIQRGLVTFRLPDGREDYVDFPKGMMVPVFDRTAVDPVIGRWYPRLGYVKAEVPRTSLEIQR